jgi:hypothetical protein
MQQIAEAHHATRQAEEHEPLTEELDGAGFVAHRR